MMTMGKCATTLCLLMLLCTAAAAEQIGHRATYEVRVGPLTVGKMEQKFELSAEGNYKFYSNIKSTGLAALIRSDEMQETSSGHFLAGRYLPTRYTQIRKNKKKPRNIETIFDRTASKVNTFYNGERSELPLGENSLDKLTYQAALMHDLALDTLATSYSIVDRGKQKTYEPVIEGEVVVETIIGALHTIIVVRGRQRDKRQTKIWYAPELGYVPVQIFHRDKDGREMMASIETYEAIAALPADI